MKSQRLRPTTEGRTSFSTLLLPGSAQKTRRPWVDNEGLCYLINDGK